MTERYSKNGQAVPEFYDALAEDYDAMTGFQKRFIHEKPFFRLLVDQHSIQTAVDAGCGTGFHALLLAQLGVEVTAVDISREMLHRLQMHAREMHLKVHVVKSIFQHLTDAIRKTHDAVFCMGNSLVHILSRDDLRQTLMSFSRLLIPHGLLFIQILNYDRIMAHRERVQSVKESEGKTFVRYYEYDKETIQFSILKIEKREGNLEHAVETIELRPILKDELLQLLSETGFVDVKACGGISMEDFRPKTSKDLVLLARKSP